MIKLVHIAPTALIKYVDDCYNKGLNMVLTHLVLRDEAYREAFKQVNEGLELFKQNGYKVMCIPKDANQFRDFMYSPSIDYVGLSEEHFAYRHCPGVRYEVLRDNLTSEMPKKKIHLLGATDSVRELSLLKPFEQYINSWDSSAAIWQGYLGNLLETQQRKDCTPVIFDKDMEFNLFMRRNITFLEEQIK